VTRNTRNPDALTSAVRTGSARPWVIMRLRVTVRYALRSCIDWTEPRHARKSCVARGSALFADASQFWSTTIRSACGSGITGNTSWRIPSNVPAPTQIANAMEKPPTIVSTGYFPSIRPPSLKSIHEKRISSNHPRPRALRAFSTW
jgi:hypothetical protein